MRRRWRRRRAHTLIGHGTHGGRDRPGTVPRPDPGEGRHVVSQHFHTKSNGPEDLSIHELTGSLAFKTWVRTVAVNPWAG
jgi:hypothetical protein